MAAKTKVQKSKDGSKAIENKRWIFDDDMTERSIKKAKETILKAI